MSDFLAWLSLCPVPDAVYRRWNWPGEARLGTRHRAYMPLGVYSDERSLLVMVGWNRGTRSEERPLGQALLASRLEKEFAVMGPEALDQFLGPFAGVHIDHATQSTTVWRDRFGRIPIQMVSLDQGWAVTTCPETAQRLAGHQPNRDHLLAFLADDRSTDDVDALAGLHRIRPAEVVRFDKHHEISGRHHWWHPAPREIDSGDADQQMTNRLQQLGAHFGQKPHILALSAGLDSAALAAVATSRHPGSEAITFVDPGSPRDEGPQAQALANHLGLRWAPFRIDRHCPLTRLDDHRFPKAWGPAGHPDMAWKLPCHRWLEMRRPNLPILYGNGADDVLWVPTYLWLRDRWRHVDLPSLFDALPHLSAMELIRPGLGHAVDRLNLRGWRERLPSAGPPDMVWEQTSRWIDEPLPSQKPPSWPAKQRLYHLRLWRLQTWRWERAMRSLALESRLTERPIFTPFLDATFWELSLSLSPGHLVEGGRQKAILRRAVGDLLPAGCRRRPKVGGFDPVVERGLADMASRRVYALFARPRLADQIAFEAPAFLEAYDAYRRSPGCGQAATYRGSWAIWKTVAAELWLHQ